MADAWTAADRAYMRRALSLARRGFTTPNPMVGCLLVRDGRVVGEGFHRLAGEPHAEANALAAAGSAARGATAYVTLEPCAHFGRTPPCSRALIDAGVSRVIAAVADPDSRVSGRGLNELAKAGIATSVGLLEEEARRLNEEYFHHRLTGLPFVILKAAMTLDGKIATSTGSSKWITGEAALRYVHRMRARAGAVLCGIGTVLADDPLLTSRMTNPPRQPLRIILDSELRTPIESQIATTARQFPTLIVCSNRADEKRPRLMEQLGIEILTVSADKQERAPLKPVLSALGHRGITSVLVEGGSRVHASFLRENLPNRLCWFIAPKVVGGEAAPGPVADIGIEQIEQAILLSHMSVRRLGADLLVEADPRSRSPGKL